MPTGLAAQVLFQLFGEDIPKESAVRKIRSVSEQDILVTCKSLHALIFLWHASCFKSASRLEHEDCGHPAASSWGIVQHQSDSSASI